LLAGKDRGVYLLRELLVCGEDAGRPVEAVCFAAMGMNALSMRPASIGPVKSLIRRTNITELRDVIDETCGSGAQSVRAAVMDYLAETAKQ
jgi:phosphotransferase system enzyme I (PtsP)